MGGKLTAGHYGVAYENSDAGRMVLLANGLVEEWGWHGGPKLRNLCRDALPKWKLIGEEIHVYRKAEIGWSDDATIFKITPTGNLFLIGILDKGARILIDELNRSDPSNPFPDLIYKRIP